MKLFGLMLGISALAASFQPIPRRAPAPPAGVPQKPVHRRRWGYRANARRAPSRGFVAMVEATHSDREDPRKDHYLHSHARRRREAARRREAET